MERVYTPMRIIRSGILALAGVGRPLCTSCAARGRNSRSHPSNHPSAAPAGGQVHVGVQIDGAQVHCTYLSLKDYIRIAYQVKDFQVTGPDWMASERFDIHAKLPDGGRGQFREMLQKLLEDRFQIKMHRASKGVSGLRRGGRQGRAEAERVAARSGTRRRRRRAGRRQCHCHRRARRHDGELRPRGLLHARRQQIRSQEAVHGGPGRFARAFRRASGRGHDGTQGNLRSDASNSRRRNTAPC